MKNIILIIILSLLNISVYAYDYLDFTKQLDAENLSYVYEFANNHDIDKYSINIYPYKIIIHKFYYDINSNQIYKVNNTNFNVLELINNYIKEETKEYIVNDEEYKIIRFAKTYNTQKETEDVSSGDVPFRSFVILYDKINDNVLTLWDKNNKLLWDCSYSNANGKGRILDIKKYNDALIILYYNEGNISVDFVYSYEKPIIEHHIIGPFMDSDNGYIISNNIIKLKLNHSNYIEYWKIQNFEKDMANYEKIKSDNDLRVKHIENSIFIWSNKTINPRYKMAYNNYKSYDYFEQDTESTIEQLKEKFPDDTFFGDEVEDEEEIKTSSNSPISEGVTGISDATQSQDINSHNNFFVQIFNKCKSFFANLIHPRVSENS